MTVIQKTIGRLPVNLGDYDSTKSYGKKNRVLLYGCEWESKVENNTYAPASLNTTTGVITPDTTHWKLISGSYNTWLIDNGYKKIDAANVKDGNNTQHEINNSVTNEIGTDSTPSSIKGRVKSLENAVGTGGSVDLKIVSAVNTEKNRAEGVESGHNTRIEALETAVGSGGSVDERIATEGARHYLKTETYTKTEVNGLVDTPHQEYVTVDAYSALPATGSKDTIYRVSNYNGSTSQVDESVYSEYAWDGSQYVFLCVKSQIGEVFDISAYNNNAKYADLEAALNGGANIPQSLQKGGMSVKFVQSSDNKYVQFRCIANAFTTDTMQWQGEDVEPTAGSKNLVESGGINKSLNVFRKDLGGNLCSKTINLPARYVGNYFTISLEELGLNAGEECDIHFLPSNSDTNTNIYYTTEGGRTAIQGGVNSEVYYTDYKIPSDATGFQLYTGNVISALEVIFEVSYKGDVKKDISTIRNSYTYSLENSFTQDTANKIMFTDCLLKAGDICVLDVICDGTFKYHIYYTDINGDNAGGAIIAPQTTSGTFKFEIPENVYGFNVWTYSITGTANVKVGVRKVVLLKELNASEIAINKLEDNIKHKSVLTKQYNFRSDTNDLSLVLSDYNIKPGDRICVETESSGTFKYHLYFYNSSDENIKNITANAQGNNTYVETVPENAYKFRVYLFGASGDCVFTFNVRYVITVNDLVDITSADKQYSYLSILRNLNRSAINPSTGLPFVTYKPLSMLVYSDIHHDTVRNNRVLEFFRYAKKENLVNDSLLCGDIAGGTWDDYDTDFSDAPGMNEVLKVIGNHDIVGEPTPTAQQIYNRYLDNIENWGVVQPDDAAENGLCYYYKDYSDSKIRLIVLDFSTLIANSAQLSWLEGVLEDARQNELAVICTMHIPFNTTYELFDTTFNCIDYQPTGMTQNTSALTAVDAFIHNGGEFVCWLFGHIHTDWIGKYTIEDRNQVFISLGAAMINLGHWEDCARVEGTESEDNFSLISFDTDKKTISLYRVGAHYDRYMRHKEMLTINYGNSSLIASY